MNRSKPQAFTLVEMLTVMLVIAVIAGLIVGVAGYAGKKSSLTQADGEIKNLATAIEAYKVDAGTVPRLEDTTEPKEAGSASPIDPRVHGTPQSSAYKKANIFLYQQLTGDQNLDRKFGDEVQGQNLPVYFTPPEKALGTVRSSGQVEYIRDPFGNPYGYSTAAAQQADANRVEARDQKASVVKGGDSGPEYKGEPQGFNNTYDLWSTAGDTSGKPTDLIRNRWIKNW